MWTLKSFLQYILNGLRLLDRSGFFGQTRWKKCFEVVNERLANRAVQFLLKNNNQVLFKENSGHISVLWTYIGVFIYLYSYTKLFNAGFFHRFSLNSRRSKFKKLCNSRVCQENFTNFHSNFREISILYLSYRKERIFSERTLSWHYFRHIHNSLSSLRLSLYSTEKECCPIKTSDGG